MKLFGQILKKSATDLWDELMLMLLFNVIWAIGSVLIIPFPFLTFGLFFIAYDVIQGKGIKLGRFFGYGRQHWKPAYVWGVIALGVLWLLGYNVLFYGRIAAVWAAVLQALFLALAFFWVVWQMIAVAMYPRLQQPGFRLAARNAAVLMGKNLPEIGLTMALIALLLVLTVLVPVLGLLLTVSFVALLLTNLVDFLLKRELAASAG